VIFSILLLLGLSAQSARWSPQASGAWVKNFHRQNKTTKPGLVFEDSSCDASLYLRDGQWVVRIYSVR